VLVVEDEAPVRALLVKILREGGYEVLEAARGEEALERCRAHPGDIHLLIADIVMPGLRGPEVARRARALRPGLPVLFMSGYLEEGAVSQLEGLPADAAFLAKPFTPEALARKVLEVLQSRAARAADGP
jgi:two-component system cell cycle sensor histidine kinase/response regulator CckA